MKVLMKEHAAGPFGHYFEGESHDVPEELARHLIEARAAVKVDPETVAEVKPETTALLARGKRA
jgi:hypothetical protein